MKILVSILLLCAISCFHIHAQPSYIWAASVGKLTNGNDIAIDNAGNVISVGQFKGMPDFDPGTGIFNLVSSSSNGGYIWKLSPTGALVWAKQIGNKYGSIATRVTTDRFDNIYVAGPFSDTIDLDPGPGTYQVVSRGRTDGYLVKLSPSGNFIWGIQIGGKGNQDYFEGIKTDSRGNVYCVGMFDSTVDFDPGAGIYNLTAATSIDAFIWKLDSLGRLLWVKQISGTNDERANCIALDADTNIYVAGSFTGIVDLDPGPATQNVSSAGKMDMFIIKLDTAGSLRWAKSISDTANDIPAAIAARKGSIYLCGDFHGSVDFDPGLGVSRLIATPPANPLLLPLRGDIYILKLNAAGNYQWAETFGSRDYDVGIALAIDSQGAVYTAGGFTDTVDFDPGPATFNLIGPNENAFISKLDSNGKFVWAYQAGGTASEAAVGLALAPNGYLHATGYSFSKPVDFDPCPSNKLLVTKGDDAFVVKLNQNKCEPATGGGGPDSTTSVGSLVAENSIVVYPNPVRDVLNVLLPKDQSGAQVRLFNTSGQLLAKWNFSSCKPYNIDISFLSTGIYFIETSLEGTVPLRQRIIKQ